MQQAYLVHSYKTCPLGLEVSIDPSASKTSTLIALLSHKQALKPVSSPEPLQMLRTLLQKLPINNAWHWACQIDHFKPFLL